MAASQVYRTIVVLDIEQFGRVDRDDQVRIQLRRGLHEAFAQALTSVGIPAGSLSVTSTGDGLLVLVDPAVETARVLHGVINRFADEVAAYNRLAAEPAQLRVRAVVHAAHVLLDDHGATGEQVNHAFRLLDCPALRIRLQHSASPLAAAVSAYVFQQVVRHRPLGLNPTQFRLIAVHVKETRTDAWVYSPHLDRSTGPADLATRHAWADPAFGLHWEPRARGVQRHTQSGWHFTGREQVLRELVAWLAEPPDGTVSTRVVTGDPGSGKSAVLARLVTLAHPQHRPAVPPDVLAAAPHGTIPPPGCIHVALHAAGKPPEQLIEEFTEAIGMPACRPEELVERILERAEPLVLLIDALDEATAPARLVRDLLRPLAFDGGEVGIRLLIGTRRNLLELLPGAIVYDLDAPAYLNPADVTEYVRRLLVVGRGPDARSPYAERPEMASRVAAAVAARAERNFLVAQLTARALATEARFVDTSQPDWQQQLPATVEAAMDRYLAGVHRDEQRVRDLLRPLAWAEGEGLADDGLWAELATELGTASYQGHDVRWLRDTAASNLLQATQVADEVVAYRLFHSALAEQLRARTPTVRTQQTIARVLRARIPSQPDPATGVPRPDWLAADDYTRTHLATHAAAARQLDPLVDDALFLVAASPAHLRHALLLDRAASERAPHRVYQQTAHLLLETDPGCNAAYLELNARLEGALELADRLAALPLLRRPWQVSWAHSRPPGLDMGVALTGPVRAVATAILPDKMAVAVSGGDDGTLQVWDVLKSTPFGAPLRGHTGTVWAIATSLMPDDRLLLVSGAADQTLRVWDLLQRTQLGTPLRGHTGTVRSVATATLPDGRVVAVSGGQDGTLRLWELPAGTPLSPPLRGHDWVRSVAAVVSEQGWVRVISGGGDGQVRVWDPVAGRPIGTPQHGHSRPILAMAAGLLPGQKPIAISGSEDTTIKLWNPAEGTQLGPTVRVHSDKVWSIATTILPDGRVVAVSASYDGTVRVWELPSGTPIGPPLRGHAGWTHRAAIAELPDGRIIAMSGSHDGSVRVWDAVNGTPIGLPLRGHTAPVHAIASTVLPNGQVVAISGSDDGSAHVWDLIRGTLIGPAPLGDTGRVWAIATVVVPDGRVVAVSGTEEGSAHVWDLIKGTSIGPALQSHTGRTEVAIAALPGGQVIAVTGDSAGVVRIWDAIQCTPIGPPREGHTSEILAVTTAWLPDGRLLVVTGGDDGMVQVWEFTDGKLMNLASHEHTGTVRAVGVGALSSGRVVIASGGDNGKVQIREPQRSECLHEILLGNSIHGITLVSPDAFIVVTAAGLLRLNLNTTAT